MPRKPKPAAKPVPARTERVALTTEPAATARAAASPAPPPAPAEASLEDTLLAAFGTRSKPLAATLLTDATGALGLPADHPAREQREAAARELLRAFEPKSGIEAALAASFAGLHSGAHLLLRKSAHPGAPDEMAGRLRRDAMAMLKVANETIRALQELRGKVTHQRVIVERLAVAEGGQCIVGPVDGGGPRDR
jgi:hypothetical protein